MSVDRFAKSMEELFYVYTQLDFAGVLTCRFPNKETFFEDKAEKINYSFLKFLDTNTELNDSAKTTLKENFENGKYTSIYDIFHDIKLASITQLLQYENNSNIYSKIDKFYKVSTEILLREAIRLGSYLTRLDGKTETSIEDQLLKSNGGDDSETKDGDKIKEQLSQLQPVESAEDISRLLEKDFEIISSTFYSNTGKALSVFGSGNIPFFSSLNNYQSELDDREPIIDPLLGITVTNVIPNIPSPSNENMSKFAESNIKIPNIRQILENYMHPNWLRLISSQWLKHGSGLTSLNFSFAPTYDETQSIISNDWKGLIWCQQIGFKKLVEAKLNYDKLLEYRNTMNIDDESKLKTDEENFDKKEINSDDKKEINSDDKKDNGMEDTDENKEIVDEALDEENSSDKIDLGNILQFDEHKLVTDDESKIIESNNVQSTISDLLSDLSQLRQDRIEKQKKRARYNKNILGTGSKIVKPSNDEIKLYNKIRRLITGLIESKNIKPDDLSVEIDKRIPVLQHVYQGTLPASFAVSSNRPTKYKRRR